MKQHLYTDENCWHECATDNWMHDAANRNRLTFGFRSLSNKVMLHISLEICFMNVLIKLKCPIHSERFNCIFRISFALPLHSFGFLLLKHMLLICIQSKFVACVKIVSRFVTLNRLNCHFLVNFSMARLVFRCCFFSKIDRFIWIDRKKPCI